jgi:hypothetical protein
MNRPSAREWRDKAESCRRRVALYRGVIARAESSGGCASYPGWMEIKEILLEIAEDLEREAAEADTRSAEIC